MLRRVTGVAAMPGSGRGAGAAPHLAGIARGVADRFGAPVVGLRRARGAPGPQKALPAGADPDANQAGTMEATLSGDPAVILVIDDFMRDGSTVREAGRALRAAGAETVGAVALVKDIRGTRRYRFRGGR